MNSYQGSSNHPSRGGSYTIGFLFKPPYAWDKLLEKNKSENRWLEQNFHGLMWRAGSIPYDELSNTLRGVLDGAEIYVKGLEKSKWLKRFFPDK